MSTIPHPENPTQANQLLRALPESSREDVWHHFLRAAATPYSTAEGVRNAVIQDLRSGLSRTHPDITRYRTLLALLSRPNESLELAREAIRHAKGEAR
jgi:hypothetical protein